MPLTRRRLLLTAAVAVVGRRAGSEPPLRIVVAGGHPGDPEYGCGGTVARYADQGHSVTLLYLNRGQGPTDGPPECRETEAEPASTIRTREATDAARILGAQTAFLDQCNGHAVVDAARYKAATDMITELAPDVIFNQWPIDNHPDHRALSNLMYEAWLRLDRRPALYYYEVSDGEDTEMFHPTDYVDISAVEPRKRAACYAHASQDPDRYYDLQLLVARLRGAESGYAQAEAFIRHTRSRPAPMP